MKFTLLNLSYANYNSQMWPQFYDDDDDLLDIALQFSFVLAIIGSSICKCGAVSNDQRGNVIGCMRKASVWIKIFKTDLYVFLLFLFPID